MPVLDGFSAAERIKKALPNVPVLMFSMHDGPEVLQASKLVQAQGFVTKSEDANVLLETLWRSFFAARISFQTMAISQA